MVRLPFYIGIGVMEGVLIDWLWVLCESNSTAPLSRRGDGSCNPILPTWSSGHQ